MTSFREALLKMKQLDQEKITTSDDAKNSMQLIAQLFLSLPKNTPVRFRDHLEDLSNYLRTTV